MNSQHIIISLVQLFDKLPEEERILVDVLRQIIIENLRGYGKEKIAFGVPYFYGKKGICIIWPASVPRGGFKQGVLLGFWQGYKLKDEDGFLTQGTNKKVFYKIYKHVDEIDERAIVKLLKMAIVLDKSF
jgi:hypothetical protein